MARQMLDLEEELGRIWSLVGELSEQLANNRTLVSQLMARSDNVKGQAAHVGTGFPLRRFNLDIADEEFQSELEKFASHLILENQQLQHENKQVNALLKEYEVTLETVMGKFRGVAHASQQHDLALHSYYSSLLQSLQTAHASAQLHDDTSLSLLLTRLSTLLRTALRSLGGEEVDSDLLLSLHRAAVPNGNASSDDSGPPSPRTTSSGPPQRPRGRPTPFAGFQPGATGGYSGTDGHSDWALEREMEIQRLEEENKALREMLAIAEESAVTEMVEEEIQEEEKEPEPEPQRKSSLTVEELEASAEQEEAETKERERAVEAGEISGDLLDAQGTPIDDGERAPGTGLGGGGGVGQGQQRPILSQSMLGFTAEAAPPEEAIDDGPEMEGEAES